ASPALHAVHHTTPRSRPDAYPVAGLSAVRCKFAGSSAATVPATSARAGTIDVTVQIDSVDFGHDEMNRHAVAPDIFDAARYPTATFKGRFTKFDGDRPEEAVGEFTLRGVTRTLTLDIDDFKCMHHPMEKREVCGADVSTSFNRG